MERGDLKSLGILDALRHDHGGTKERVVDGARAQHSLLEDIR